MLVIGHRGASVAAPENTVRAFELAWAMGADGVELDVRLAADGRLLVKHDPLSDDQPADHSPDGSVVATSGAPIELAVAIEACRDLLVNVEIKNSPGEAGYDSSLAVVEPTVEVLRSYGRADRWIISSFDWPTIQRCRDLAGDIATAWLVESLTDVDVELTAEAGHRAIHPHESSVEPANVARCHDAGLAVNVWTCNDAARIRELSAIGVDGVCTDVPDAALVALGRRTGPVRTRWGRPA